MLHVLTVQPASSTSDRRYGLPLNMTFWQAMAGSAQRAAATRLRVSRLSTIFHVYFTHYPRCSHPTEPQCSYDPVEGLPLAPDADPLEKIKELEEQVGASHPSHSCSRVAFSSICQPYSQRN